ncbi:MAG TPA: ATP-binding cassette domain-containing protein, partial [Candidatus Acidoferrum sp.]|nr:ATP-binding cassette domain-containing protein [Candidatus Acidoferrum sp.]
PGFDRALAERHLDHLAIPLRSRATTLSGGQQAQVMLAVALGTRADVLLLDEPLASLDPLARSEFLTVLRTAVREGGSTALLSSHIVTDVEQVCDRLIVLGIGHVVLDDALAHAVAGHAVRVHDVDGAPDAAVVGRFPTDAGPLITLVRVAGPVPPGGDLRPATLDEVVKGYLSAARHSERSAA